MPTKKRIKLVTNKSSNFRRSYKEEDNLVYRNEEFRWKSINYKDWIVEKGVRKYRVKWRASRYSHTMFQSDEVQDLLEYFADDILDTEPSERGVKVYWKDSYIAADDIISE